jgi:hypothetical protein
MRNPSEPWKFPCCLRVPFVLAVLIAGLQAQSPPELTAPGAIAALKADAGANPGYDETCNLCPTGLRGWIHLAEGGGENGTFTDAGRQIPVPAATSPHNWISRDSWQQERCLNNDRSLESFRR